MAPRYRIVDQCPFLAQRPAASVDTRFPSTLATTWTPFPHYLCLPLALSGSGCPAEPFTLYQNGTKKGTGGTVGETPGTEIVAVEGRETAEGATAETGAAAAAGAVPARTRETVPRVGPGETDRPSGKGLLCMYEERELQTETNASEVCIVVLSSRLGKYCSVLLRCKYVLCFFFFSI